MTRRRTGIPSVSRLLGCAPDSAQTSSRWHMRTVSRKSQVSGLHRAASSDLGGDGYGNEDPQALPGTTELHYIGAVVVGLPDAGSDPPAGSGVRGPTPGHAAAG